MGGELFEYVSRSRGLNERICRYFFKQILKALIYLRSKGLYHLELKPENILLDKNFNVKLVNVWHITPEQERKQCSFGGAMNCSPQYLPPEVLYNEQSRGYEVDLFALGIILFILRSNHYSFDKMARKKDPFYKLIVHNNSNLFWKAWE